MASLGMDGPFRFDKETIIEHVPEDMIGNYAIGEMREQIFIVLYVGRSDTDLRERLIQHLAECDRYTHFKFSMSHSVLDSYKKECKNWHDFGGGEGRLFNEIHPDCPDGFACPCPFCGALERKSPSK